MFFLTIPTQNGRILSEVIYMNFDKHIDEIENKIGYVFKDKSLLKQAFTRTSYANEHRGRSGLRYQSNEVLEFFGDSVLSTAIVTLLMRDFADRYEYGISTTLNEGDFSNIKSKLSDKKNLSLTTKSLGLQKYLLMGEGDLKLGVENEPSVMEDLFESIIGAIYIDCGNEIKTVIGSVAKMLDVQEYLTKKEPTIQSYKNALQEWCAHKSRRLPEPVYKTVSESGPDHKKTYERACYIGNKICGTGHGKNQKLADAEAAKAALDYLMKEEERSQIKKEKDGAEGSLQKLKELAAKEKIPSPEFRDLGESEKSTASKKDYRIECRFRGVSATASAPEKRTARLMAAQSVLSLINQKNESKAAVKKAPVQKNKASNTKKADANRRHATPKK